MTGHDWTRVACKATNGGPFARPSETMAPLLAARRDEALIHVENVISVILAEMESGGVSPPLDNRVEKLGTALGVPLRDLFGEFEEQRGMPPERLELEHRLRDVTRSLSDEEVRIALELVEIVAKHRRGQRRGRG